MFGVKGARARCGRLRAATMQRSDTLFVLRKLMEMCNWLMLFNLGEEAKGVLLLIVFVLGNAWHYDYTLRHAARNYFIRADLLFPRDAPYYKVLETGNDMAFIQLVRMPKAVFDLVIANCDQDWLARIDGFTDRTRQHTRPGNRHILRGKDMIALALLWLGSQTSMHHLELIFGVGHSVLQRDLKIGLEYLEQALRLMVETACEWPTPQEMLAYALAIEEVRGACPYPSVRVWGWLDGLRLRMLNPDDPEVQRLWYNGWVGYANAVNVLLGLPTGKFAFACLNHPGSKHDYTVARAIFEKLASLDTPLFHVVAGDSAFASGATNSTVGTKDSFVPPVADTIGKTPAELAVLEERWKVWIGAVRQSTEHGMRTLQAVWGRLKTELPSDANERGQIIELCVRLHNLKWVFTMRARSLPCQRTACPPSAPLTANTTHPPFAARTICCRTTRRRPCTSRGCCVS